MPNPALNTVPPERRSSLGTIEERSRSPIESARPLAYAAVLILILRLAVSLALIPPWQQPDEPIQVAVAEVWRSRIDGSATADPGREAEIIRSMVEHRWWEHYGRTPPAGPPARFTLIPLGRPNIGIDPVMAAFPMPYYWAVGRMLSLVPSMPVDTDLYVMRVLSATLALLLLWVAWLGTREALGETAAAIVVLLLALHPQFGVTATSANPDMFINLAGACIWWQGTLALKRPGSVVPLALVWLAAASAAFVDRLGVPLLGIGLLVTLVVVISRMGLRFSTLALAAIATGVVAAALWAIDATWRVFPSGSLGYQLSLVPIARTWGFFVTFTSFLVESWWLALGWVRYAPPRWWVAIAFLLSAGAIGGLTWRLVNGDDVRARSVALMALMITAVQLAAVYWTYYRVATGPQGRYLFPVLVPMVVLLWMGVEGLVPVHRRRSAAVAVVLTFALLGTAAWIVVAMPAYAD